VIAILLAFTFFSSASANLILHDASRNRDIPIKVYYPANTSRSVPLIVFSHGFGGTKDGYQYLGQGWSQAGYVVILPTHIGSDHDAVIRYGATVARDPAASFELQQDRTADVKYILSSLDQLENRIPALKRKIDRKKIGVAGHSMGAGTAMLLGGAEAAASGRLQAFRDPRVTAIITMSPQGSGEEGFDAHSWDNMRIPVMTMSGTLDLGVGGQPPSWRQEAYKHMPAGDKYQVIVRGARHLSFAIGTEFHDCILAESTAFWNRYLRSENSAITTQGACSISSK
jgi:predicted dienelactone hydrolase